jgi:hypothetical protein
MRLKNLIPAIAVFLVSFFVLSCAKETEEFISDSINDYLPTVVGKYITYRLDSTVFTNQGRNEEVHKYRVKHVVDAQITDNLGRPAYRIIRYLSDSAGTLPWVPNGTYFITPLNDQVEIVDNNLRSIKLHLPVKNNYNWKGNKYFSDDPYEQFCSLNSFDQALNETDFYYDGATAGNETINGQVYKDVITIQQEDESFNFPNTNPTSYAERIFGKEKYSKGIGLVYRETILWEYQPNTGGGGGGYKCGFGIKMWMIDHN